MKSKSLVLLAFAGICGLVAMVGVRKALNNKEPAVETVSVLVATGDLDATSRLDETNTEFKAVPVDSVPEGAITDRSQCIERQLLVRVMPGDWITVNKLSEKGVAGVVGQIPKGMRVVSVPVNQTTSHSGMLAPGNRVDVMLTFQARTDQGSIQKTRTVLQYIEIFAVDKVIDGAKANVNEATSRNVSVLVAPDQAQRLLLAGRRGDIHLALRSSSDSEVLADVEIDIDDLMGSTTSGESRSRRELLEEQYGLGEDGEALTAEAPQPDVDTALAQAMGSVASQTTVVDPVPAPNVWQMTIYSGNEAKVLEVVDQDKEPVAPAKETAKGGSFWKGLVGTYLGGTK